MATHKEVSALQHAEGHIPTEVVPGSRYVRLLRISSRVGALGLLTGAYSLLGMPLPGYTRVVFAAGGLLAGGAGTLLASSIVLLRLRGPVRILELAAAVGLALGASALILGASLLMGRWGGMGPLFVLAYLGVPVLGLALVFLFLTGLLKRLFADHRSELESR